MSSAGRAVRAARAGRRRNADDVGLWNPNQIWPDPNNGAPTAPWGRHSKLEMDKINFQVDDQFRFGHACLVIAYSSQWFQSSADWSSALSVPRVVCGCFYTHRCRSYLQQEPSFTVFIIGFSIMSPVKTVLKQVFYSWTIWRSRFVRTSGEHNLSAKTTSNSVWRETSKGAGTVTCSVTVIVILVISLLESTVVSYSRITLRVPTASRQLFQMEVNDAPWHVDIICDFLS